MMRTLVVVVLMLCLVCCERGHGPGGGGPILWEGTVRDSAGVTIVENHGAPVWGEDDSWAFTPVRSIGLSDDNLRYQFGSISSVAWLSDGTIAVADQIEHNVRFFSADGTLLASVGREGSGPEEFQDLYDLVVGPSDTVVALDWGTYRASRITSDGKWHGSFSIAPQDGFMSWYWADDAATGHLATLVEPMSGPLAPPDRRFGFVVLRHIHGRGFDTIARVPGQEYVTVGSGGAMLLHHFPGRGEVALCDGTAVVGHSDDLVFRWHRVDGTVVRIVTLERASTPITEFDQRVLLDAVDRIARERGAPPAEAARAKASLRFEEHYPAWRKLVCGPAGTLLVQRPRPLRELSEEEMAQLSPGAIPPGGDWWDVFDATGRYLGVVPLPAEPARHAFRRDAAGNWLMIGKTQDDFGVPFVGVWRITRIRPPESSAHTPPMTSVFDVWLVSV
jgi:hypothetical protein